MKSPKIQEGLQEVSKWLGIVQEAAQELRPGMDMLIGGGSARDVLDHIYTGRPFSTRDIDIFLVLGKQVDPEKTERFFSRLQNRGLGALKTSDLRVKRRFNPALPFPHRYQHVSGYGAHYFRTGLPILSITLLHTAHDLQLNGLLNIDKIYVRIGPKETLVGFANRIHAEWIPHTELTNRGLIIDEFGGYSAWVESRPELLNWGEVERSPSRMAVRIVRSFAKAGKPQLPHEVTDRFRSLLDEKPEIDDETEFRRGFVKVFSDKHWNQELRSLAQIGVLKRISPELERVTFRDDAEVPAKDWKSRWEVTMRKLPANESARLHQAFAPAMASSFAN